MFEVSYVLWQAELNPSASPTGNSQDQLQLCRSFPFVSPTPTSTRVRENMLIHSLEVCRLKPGEMQSPARIIANPLLVVNISQDLVVVQFGRNTQEVKTKIRTSPRIAMPLTGSEEFD
jgi:hypothetical protein